MSLYDQPESATKKHVYHMPLSVLYLPGGIIIFTLILILFLFETFDGTVFLIMTGVCCGIMSLLALLVRFGIRVVTSPEGIAYYNMGFRVRTSWENVRGIGTVVQSGRKVEALLLGRDALEM